MSSDVIWCSSAVPLVWLTCERVGGVLQDRPDQGVGPRRQGAQRAPQGNFREEQRSPFNTNNIKKFLN